MTAQINYLAEHKRVQCIEVEVGHLDPAIIINYCKFVCNVHWHCTVTSVTSPAKHYIKPSSLLVYTVYTVVVVAQSKLTV
jgi:hypothetical protein